METASTENNYSRTRFWPAPFVKSSSDQPSCRHARINNKRGRPWNLPIVPRLFQIAAPTSTYPPLSLLKGKHPSITLFALKRKEIKSRDELEGVENLVEFFNILLTQLFLDLKTSKRRGEKDA